MHKRNCLAGNYENRRMPPEFSIYVKSLLVIGARTFARGRSAREVQTAKSVDI